MDMQKTNRTRRGLCRLLKNRLSQRKLLGQPTQGVWSDAMDRWAVEEHFARTGRR